MSEVHSRTARTERLALQCEKSGEELQPLESLTSVARGSSSRQAGQRVLIRDGALGERDNPMSEDHVRYDSQLIQKFADRLYAEADRVVMQSTVVATLVGVIAGYVIAAVTRVPTVGFVLVCAIVAGGMGFVRGREKAFTFKWQAQQALCLMHTERNTRFVAVSVSRRSAEAVLQSDRPAEQGQLPNQGTAP